MGVAAAFLSCAFFAVLFAGQVAANPVSFRAQIDAQMDKANQQMAALNFDPEGVRMAQAMFAGTRGLVLFTAMAVFVSLIFLVIFGGVAGALSAGLARDKSP